MSWIIIETKVSTRTPSIEKSTRRAEVAPLFAERMAAYMEPDLARILLAAVAIDCRGFDPKVRGTKFSGRDVKAAHSLLDVLGPKVSDRSGGFATRVRPIPSGVFDAATIPDLAKLLGAARDVTGLTAWLN